MSEKVNRSSANDNKVNMKAIIIHKKERQKQDMNLELASDNWHKYHLAYGSMGIISVLVFVNCRPYVCFHSIDWFRSHTLNIRFHQRWQIFIQQWQPTTNSTKQLFWNWKDRTQRFSLFPRIEPFLVTLCCTNLNNRCFIFFLFLTLCRTASFITSIWERYVWFGFDPRNIYSKTIV